MRMLLCCPAAAAVALWAATPLRAQQDTARIDSALARQIRTPQATFYWRLEPLSRSAGGGFYAIVGRSRTEDSPAAVLLCAGMSRADTTTASCLPLPTPGRPSGLGPDDPTNFDVQEGDFDRDGKPELSLRLRYGVQSYTGEHEHNQFYVVDTQPTLRVAASVYVYLRRGIGTDVEMTFEDLNGDGHPDVVVRAQACRLPPEEGALIGCRPIVRRLIWNARTDSWAAR